MIDDFSDAGAPDDSARASKILIDDGGLPGRRRPAIAAAYDGRWQAPVGVISFAALQRRPLPAPARRSFRRRYSASRSARQEPRRALLRRGPAGEHADARAYRVACRLDVARSRRHYALDAAGPRTARAIPLPDDLRL